MKLGVISDSHQNLAYLAQAVKALSKERIELLAHLGDDYRDISEEVKTIKVVKVPGVYDPEYEVTSIPHRLVIPADGIKVLLTHSAQAHENDFPDEPSPAELAQREGAKLILYGHTHIPAIQEKEGFVWVNPGHLKPADKKGYPASYAVIEIKSGRIKIGILNLISRTKLLEKNCPDDMSG